LVEPTQIPDPEPTAEPGEAAAPGSRSRVQDRINQLTAGRTRAEQEAAQVSAVNADMTQQIVNLQQEVAALRTGPQPDTTQQDLAEFFGGGSTVKGKREAPSPEALQNFITSAVGNALKPHIEQSQAAQAEAALKTAQQNSFVNAMGFLPDLENPNSDAQKLYTAIANAQPELCAIASAPEMIANMVKGILSDVGVTPPTEEKKAAISTPAPTTDLSARLGPVLETGKDVSKDVLDAFADKGKTEGLDGDEMQTMLGIELGLAKVTKE
jgi:hypothetical protein